MTDILILNGSSKCLQYLKTMGMVLGINVNFKLFFFKSVTLLELSLCSYNICVFNKRAVHHKLFKSRFLTTFIVSVK